KGWQAPEIHFRRRVTRYNWAGFGNGPRSSRFAESQSMNRIVWLYLVCILVGCSPYQADPVNPTHSSGQSEPLRAAFEKTKTVGDSADDASNLVTTIPVPEGGSPIVARADAAGTIHLLYNSADGPKYVRSSNNGKTFEAPIPVVDEGSR